MIELMIVVAIIGLVAMMVIPSALNQLPELRLEKATASLYSSLRAARMSAVHRNTDVEVTFDTDTPGYSVWVDGDQDGVRDTGEEETTDLSEAENLSLSVNNATLSYNSRGMIDSAGSNRVARARLHIPGGTAKTIAVYPNGQVDVFDF